MSTTKPTFTLRLQPKILKKIKIIAKDSKRSTAMQIELALEEYIKDYEKIKGKIDVNILEDNENEGIEE